MVLTFGEIMLRLATPGRLRFRQSLPGAVEASFGGGESNVAVSLSLLGSDAAFMTALPENPLSDCLISQLQGLGVDTSRIHKTDQGRIGIYFLETGSNQRPSVVVYDREGSSIALNGPEAYDFTAALEGVDWVHTTGITPALSEEAFSATLELVRQASDRGIPVSLDLNFRKKLWRWDASMEPRALALKCMPEILELTTVVIANEEDAADVLNIHASGTSVESGRIHAAAYLDVARAIAERFASVKHVAITLRESISANHNNWGALLYDRKEDKGFFAPLDEERNYRPYEIRNIVDRVGGGDSFGAGLIHALRSKDYSDPQAAIRFAVAASCLKHTIQGDFNLSTESEIVALMNGSESGRVQR